MDFEVSYSLENEQQFWDELEDIVSAEPKTHELIDNVLRNWLSFTTTYKGEYLQSVDDVTRCSYRLRESALFKENEEYVRRQIIYGLLQEDTPESLLFITSFLLFDGRQNESSLEMMNEEGVFPRLVDLVQSMKDQDLDLHRMLLELLYEMSRIQWIRSEELIHIEDSFIQYLLQLIEGLSDDVNDPYHYPVIRVLLVLNEQYMVLAHTPSPTPTPPLPNPIISTLSISGTAYKTFGENIILLLNRETETSLQLLILKLLYLLFTTPPTYEYFYTNDLRVLVDVMIRNLLDLPLSSMALRHTYLRVLYPLLAHTQLKLPEMHYKREELLQVLRMMVAGEGEVGVLHFGATDETTKRLVQRCEGVKWLREMAVAEEGGESPTNGNTSPRTNGHGAGSGDGHGPFAGRYLGIGLNRMAAESSLSVLEVAAQTERPGVQTPSLGVGRADTAGVGG